MNGNGGANRKSSYSDFAVLFVAATSLALLKTHMIVAQLQRSNTTVYTVSSFLKAYQIQVSMDVERIVHKGKRFVSSEIVGAS